MRVAIDTGGTFTDCVSIADGQLRVLKVFSTPANPTVAVLRALEQAGADGIDVLHGTTVGTNAMLERKGARVAFVTTAGFEDTIAIGRQTREKLYDWFMAAPECLVPEHLRFGVPERVSAEGGILRQPRDEELAELAEGIRVSGAESIAISLLFAFTNPENEQRVEGALRSLGLPVSVSHAILPEFREYERASTMVANAYLAPNMEGYILALQEAVASRYRGGRLSVMQSSGGVLSAGRAAKEPVRTVLSGPAGGVVGAYRVARHAGFDRVIGFDMGGTSTDVFLADAAAGGPQLTNLSVIGGVPISIPMLEIHTAGAGGGSIARFDRGGMLRVGPESAGSDPGPICFGRGTFATVTDANLLLGRLDTERFMNGEVKLDRERAQAAFEGMKGRLGSAEEFASGILRVIEAEMEKAIRVISVERGHDPRQFTLVAFGGGGPLHACALARALHIPRVLIPAAPGALSALGILLADAVRDYSRTVMLAGEDVAGVEEVFRELEEGASSDADLEWETAVAERSLDVRYQGQGYELNVPYGAESINQFHRAHEQRYGFASEDRPVEIVNVRLRMISAAEPFSPEPQIERDGDARQALRLTRAGFFDGGWVETAIYDRDLLRAGDALSGPAIVAEYSSGTVVPPGFRLRVDPFSNLVIEG